MEYINLDELKFHLNIETEYTNDDEYLLFVIKVVSEAISNYCNNELDNIYPLPVSIKQACLLLAGHYYTNRQIVSFANGIEIPYTFQFLLNPYKNQVIC